MNTVNLYIIRHGYSYGNEIMDKVDHELNKIIDDLKKNGNENIIDLININRYNYPELLNIINDIGSKHIKILINKSIKLQNPKLTDCGIDQCLMLKDHIVFKELINNKHIIISSNLIRAIQTALYQFDIDKLYISPFISELPTDSNENKHQDQFETMKNVGNNDKIDYNVLFPWNYGNKVSFNMFLKYILPLIIKEYNVNKKEDINIIMITHSNFIKKEIYPTFQLKPPRIITNNSMFHISFNIKYSFMSFLLSNIKEHMRYIIPIIRCEQVQ